MTVKELIKELQEIDQSLPGIINVYFNPDATDPESVNYVHFNPLKGYVYLSNVEKK